LTTAGWQADPTGRHEHRYWDGAAWTDDVADAGVAANDPLEPTVPQPASVPDLDAALEVTLADHLAVLEAAVSPEHPKVELATALHVAKHVLWILVLDPTSARQLGISFPDDPDGDRLRAASVLHLRSAEIQPDRLGAGLRGLAFHVLLALPGDEASRQACAAALGEPDTVDDVAAALGEVFFGVFDPPPVERELMLAMFRQSPGLGWHPGHLRHLHQWLADNLLPTAGATLPDDADNLLWGVTRGAFQPYALALFPDLAG
jgi:hypothetical protein